MDQQSIILPPPDVITKTGADQFFFEIYLRLSSGGRYRATCGVPIKPRSLFASIAPVDPAKTDAVCMVRSVEWLDLSFYLTFEVVERTHWLNTGELRPWNGPLDICYAFHGREK